MGAEGSKQKKGKKYSKSDIQELSNQCHFSVEQIEILYDKFKKISNAQSHDYKINAKEFQKALNLPTNEFTDHIFRAFDSDGSNQIEFGEFVLGLSCMTPEATIQEKAEFCFKIYDADYSGEITREELKDIFMISLRSNSNVSISDDQVNKIVDATFKQIDKDSSGSINLSEFSQAAAKNPSMLACVNLNTASLFTE
ncbi:Calcineurin B-like protein 7 [Tritrichomonas foetus]|uniref:Calcineurin B-like protein 7 n=1 Tax=Tritrichomonas foetus TaxID=1144522 RepID=A0A1J4JN30_9EUKA|nr:Calcineurin B-like protein 7 [Tritrichomonas foetus]|eukprot:OHS99847.1 Calcineurin B-like protein 7 [Tritrichomonas foetus]